MRFLISFIVGLLMLTTCQHGNKKNLKKFEGELFLKLIDFGPELYTTPSQDGSTLKDLLESTPKMELNEEQIILYNYYQLLKEEDLLEKNYFNFAENESIKEFVKVFIDITEYEKITLFDLAKLRETDEKVKVIFYGIRVSEFIIKCSKIKSIRKVKGAQKWAK